MRRKSTCSLNVSSCFNMAILMYSLSQGLRNFPMILACVRLGSIVSSRYYMYMVESAMPTFQELASRNAFKSHFQFGHAVPA